MLVGVGGLMVAEEGLAEPMRPSAEAVRAAVGGITV